MGIRRIEVKVIIIDVTVIFAVKSSDSSGRVDRGFLIDIVNDSCSSIVVIVSTLCYRILMRLCLGASFCNIVIIIIISAGILGFTVATTAIQKPGKTAFSPA